MKGVTRQYLHSLNDNNGVRVFNLLEMRLLKNAAINSLSGSLSYQAVVLFIAVGK
jgi:hypothetical protein